jgi:imidazolonepropionase-like amidohydrolase
MAYFYEAYPEGGSSVPKRAFILKFAFAIVVVLAGMPVAFAQSDQKAAGLPAEKTVAIHAATLIDGLAGQPRHNVLIVVKGNKIASISEGGSPPAGATVIDFPATVTVLPGLIDTHTHIFLQGEDPKIESYDDQLLKHPSSYRAARATVSVRRALEQGFTTLRDLETEGAGYGDVGIKEAINNGFIPGPRLFVVTRAISVTGGYPLEGYNPDIVVPKGAQLGDGPVELRKIARQQLDNGADWIKVYMTHRSWATKEGKLVSQPTLTLEEIKAVTDETHNWGYPKRRVACHAYGGVGLHRALDGGCDSIEHGLDLDDSAIAQMVNLVRAHARRLLRRQRSARHARRQAR